MYLNDLNSAQHSVQKINSILTDTFGHNINLSEMSIDALHRMLNTTKVKIATIKESDLTYWKNAQYNKLSLIEHSLKVYINEVAPARADGKAMKKKTMESKRLMEQGLEQAEVLLAAQELVDKLQKMVEDVAAMQVQELMPIADAMKNEIGFDVAEQYNTAADAALGSLLDQIKAAKESLENATLQAQGKPVNAPAPTDMGMDMSAEPESDDFDGADAAAGAPNVTGRELKAESAIDRMEKNALAEQKVLAAKKKVLEAAKAAGYSRPQLEKILKQFR